MSVLWTVIGCVLLAPFALGVVALAIYLIWECMKDRSFRRACVTIFGFSIATATGALALKYGFQGHLSR